jgi:dihydropteroate synthase
MPEAKVHSAKPSANDFDKGLQSLPADDYVIKTRHGTMALGRRTLLMGIINVTPDSFYDGGKRFDPAKAVADGVGLVEAGADMIDIGGESTRPGAPPVSAEEELQRVLPVVQGLRRTVKVPISIDTYKARVARAALTAGADIVNDISALRFDPEMAVLVATERVPVVLMHMQGTPQTMQAEPRYSNVLGEVQDFLEARVGVALEAGVERDNIILDPGIGFGKTLDHNLILLRGLPVFASMGYPLLVGASRKAFIGKILDAKPDERLEGSLAAAVVAVFGGAHIIRAHDVKETCRAVRVADAIRFGMPGAQR